MNEAIALYGLSCACRVRLLTSRFMNPPSPVVSIIVTPRDRFSCSETTLESIYANTPQIFDLIFVDAGSPGYIRSYLEQAAEKYGFRLIHTAWGVTPNHAKNLAIPHATGRYVAFVDNDVQVTPGWLDAMVACADETNAGIVTPLVYVGELDQRVVHMSGGELRWETRDGQRWLNESHRHFNTPQSQIDQQFVREPCGYAEFHCMLVRKSILESAPVGKGPLDESLLNVADHIDLSLRAAEAGHQVWFEPAAQITFLTPRPMWLSDTAYFRLRWSREWTEQSSRYFARKWNLHPDCPAVAGALNFGITHLAGQQLPEESANVETFFAQTNIQLYEQCAGLRYSNDELALIRRAYECAQHWQGHLYRSCGRPFLTHLIGTASILASHGARPIMVAAGLLHASYLSGTLATDGKGITPEKRQQVGGLVSPAVEYWAYLYAMFDWKGASISDLVANVERMLVPVAKTVLIKLANDLEEYVSLSTRYSPQADDALRRWSPLYSEVTRLFGMPHLTERVKKTLQEDRGLTAPPVLQAPKRASYSIT